jgi:hypothetical protein
MSTFEISLLVGAGLVALTIILRRLASWNLYRQRARRLRSRFNPKPPGRNVAETPEASQTPYPVR